MPYRIAGIDVHKRMLAVVVADVSADGEYVFERRLVGTTPEQLRALAAWLVEGEVEEVVMESTAQYWRPVWEVCLPIIRFLLQRLTFPASADSVAVNAIRHRLVARDSACVAPRSGCPAT